MLSNADLERLCLAAKTASCAAHCPYSQFTVGAALLTVEGEIFSGCNVENASSGLTICAERVAVFKAVAAGHRSFQAVVVYTPTSMPTAPCGACRQVLAEFADDLDVVSCCDGADRITTSLAELLPYRFGPEQLKSGETSSVDADPLRR